MTDWNHASLEALPGRIWSALDAAAKEASHPFRLPALGTAASAGCSVRTVVLRAADPPNRELVFYTDVRSPKAAEIRKHPRVVWLFYHPTEGVQIRAEAAARIHHGDAIALRGWEQTPIVNRVNYSTTFPPGTQIADEADSLPHELKTAAPDLKNPASGLGNFAVVRTTVSRLDWLWLNAAQHRRAEFCWDGEKFHGQWIVP